MSNSTGPSTEERTLMAENAKPKRRPPVRKNTTYLCGPPDDRCWVFGTLVADTHLKSDDKTDTDCLRCGLPRDLWPKRAAPVPHPAATDVGDGGGGRE